jgi:multidrug efflux pump subunit AcrB
MADVANTTLPAGYSHEWTGTAYQEQQASGQTGIVLSLAILFAYLFLVAMYESWMIPIPVLLSVVVGVLGSYLGIKIAAFGSQSLRSNWLGRPDRAGRKKWNIDCRIRQGAARERRWIEEAAILGAQLRFRAVMMTSIAFILGLLPLVVATGAAEISRRSIGTTVFGGMLAASSILYVTFQQLPERAKERFGRAGNR